MKKYRDFFYISQNIKTFPLVGLYFRVPPLSQTSIKKWYQTSFPKKLNKKWANSVWIPLLLFQACLTPTTMWRTSGESTNSSSSFGKNRFLTRYSNKNQLPKCQWIENWNVGDKSCTKNSGFPKTSLPRRASSPREEQERLYEFQDCLKGGGVGRAEADCGAHLLIPVRVSAVSASDGGAVGLHGPGQQLHTGRCGGGHHGARGIACALPGRGY